MEVVPFVPVEMLEAEESPADQDQQEDRAGGRSGQANVSWKLRP
jgi:hypothetical protein